MTRKQIFSEIGILLLSITSGLAQTHFIHNVTISSGGGAAASTSYHMSSTLAQVHTGMHASTSYRYGLGFWHLNEAVKKYYGSVYYVAVGWNMISVPKL